MHSSLPSLLWKFPLDLPLQVFRVGSFHYSEVVRRPLPLITFSLFNIETEERSMVNSCSIVLDSPHTFMHIRPFIPSFHIPLHSSVSKWLFLSCSCVLQDYYCILILSIKQSTLVDCSSILTCIVWRLSSMLTNLGKSLKTRNEFAR